MTFNEEQSAFKLTKPLTEGTGIRIAEALERLVLVVSTLLPGDEEPAETSPVTIMTHDGPVMLPR